MICKFCKNTFSNKYNLRSHQKRTKYCLAIQKQHDIKAVVELYHCEYCNLSMNPKTKNRHLKNCQQRPIILVERLQKEIIEKDLVIEKLQAQIEIYKDHFERSQGCIERIAEKPQITNNTTTTTTNNLLNLTPFEFSETKIKEVISKFTEEHLLQGQKGIARLVYDNMLQDENGKLKYICTDPARKTFKYKSLDGDIERDVKAKKLTGALTNGGVITKALSIANKGIEKNPSEGFIIFTSNYLDISEIKDNNGNFRGELASLTSV